MASTLLRLLLVLICFSSIPRKSYGWAVWCVANETKPDAELQTGLDWACGNGADCTQIGPGQPCFVPDTVKDHASYAFNDYFQKFKHSGGSCDFSGVAHFTGLDPSHGSCTFESIPN